MVFLEKVSLLEVLNEDCNALRHAEKDNLEASENDDEWSETFMNRREKSLLTLTERLRSTRKNLPTVS